MDEPLWTAKEVADFLNASRDSVWTWSRRAAARTSASATGGCASDPPPSALRVEAREQQPQPTDVAEPERLANRDEGAAGAGCPWGAEWGAKLGSRGATESLQDHPRHCLTWRNPVVPLLTACRSLSAACRSHGESQAHPQGRLRWLVGACPPHAPEQIARPGYDPMTLGRSLSDARQ
jgi:hypothetical protein